MATNIMRWGKTLLILFMVFALCSTMASAATTVEIIPSSKTVAQGDVFTVDIQVTPDRPLRGVQVDLSYGDSLLGSASATDGAMFDNFVSPSAGAGILSHMAGYQMPSQGAVSAQGNLAVVQFTASSTNAGTTQLDLSGVKVTDENGDELPAEDVTVIGGSVTVTGTGSTTTVVEIIPSSKTVAQGDVFTVDIQVTPDRPLRGVQVDLSYGDSLLGSASATDGAMFDNFVSPSAGAGILSHMAGYQMPSQGAVSAQGNLAAVQFTASSTNAGTTQLDLSGVKVTDENGDELPAEDVTVIGGSVTVTGTGSTTTVVEIIPSSKTVAQGDVFTVDIQVTPDRPLRGAQASLSYGDSLLGSASATDGAMFDNFVSPSAGAGILSHMAGYQMPSQGAVSAQGNLAAVQFTASSTNAGTTQLDLSGVKVTDENGDELPAEDVTVIGGSVTVTVNAPPTVTVTYPTSGTVSGTIDVIATATDTDGTVAQVAFYLMPGDTPIGTDANSAGGWIVSLDTTTVSDGDYQIKAVATDNEGATGENMGSAFAIDNSCPCDFCLDLEEGWNFVSIPKRINGSNGAVGVFNLVQGETCLHYDGCAEGWLSNYQINVVPCQGYWVYKVADEKICVYFDPGTGQSVPSSQNLCEGWNMIGHIDTSLMPVDDGSIADFGSITTLEGKFAQMWQWTQEDGYEGYPLGGFVYMTPGQGYWILVEEDATMYGTL